MYEDIIATGIRTELLYKDHIEIMKNIIVLLDPEDIALEPLLLYPTYCPFAVIRREKFFKPTNNQI